MKYTIIFNSVYEVYTQFLKKLFVLFGSSVHATECCRNERGECHNEFMDMCCSISGWKWMRPLLVFQTMQVIVNKGRMP